MRAPPSLPQLPRACSCQRTAAPPRPTPCAADSQAANVAICLNRDDVGAYSSATMPFLRHIEGLYQVLTRVDGQAGPRLNKGALPLACQPRGPPVAGPVPLAPAPKTPPAPAAVTPPHPTPPHPLPAPFAPLCRR